MELWVGYKHTEVGMIPEDWDCVAMGDIGQSLIGLTYSPSNVKEYGTLVLRSSNVQDGQLAFENNVFVDMELPKRVMVELGDILICVRNGSRHLIGKCALVDGGAKGAAFGAFMSVYRSKYSRFIFYQFQSHVIQKQIEKVMGATINQITNKDLFVFKVALPRSEIEQTAIANALSDADALIQSLTRLVEKKRQIKQGAMQTLLNPYENGCLKEGWMVKRLGDCIEKFVGGGTPSRLIKNYWGKEIPWVTVKDFSSFNSFSTQEYITSEGLKNSASNLIPKGRIILATRMALGKAVVYQVDVCINQDLKAIFPKKNIYSEYLTHWLENNVNKIEELGSGSTVMGISLDDLRKIDFSMPSKEEQTRIATILSDMDTEINALETKLTKYQQIKHGMMQNLLTGRIRLI